MSANPGTMNEMLEVTVPLLPEDKPRYLRGWLAGLSV